jgi:pimeloyl-ACP methyl ester carboxylesterase
MAFDVAGLMDARHPAGVVGASMGATIAQTLACAFPSA